MVPALALSCNRHKRVKVGGMPSPKQAELIPCTVVLYDKEGTIQRAGCQLPGDRLRWLHLRVIVLGHSIDLTHAR